MALEKDVWATSTSAGMLTRADSVSSLCRVEFPNWPQCSIAHASKKLSVPSCIETSDSTCSSASETCREQKVERSGASLGADAVLAVLSAPGRQWDQQAPAKYKLR
mmetsp:Transcript_98481/g.301299  ORF Transcript_98481/g.301299 Transcript_98481/m.301299 type:complete len:106 (+) Transcript_98481:733-1050(+)